MAKSVGGQRRTHQRDRQSARNHDLPLASDLRRDAGRFPDLKICAAHGGGYLPSYAARSDYGCNRFPEGCKVMKKHATEYLRQLYFDSMVFTPEGLRHLVAEWASARS